MQHISLYLTDHYWNHQKDSPIFLTPALPDSESVVPSSPDPLDPVPLFAGYPGVTLVFEEEAVLELDIEVLEVVVMVPAVDRDVVAAVDSARRSGLVA